MVQKSDLPADISALASEVQIELDKFKHFLSLGTKFEFEYGITVQSSSDGRAFVLIGSTPRTSSIIYCPGILEALEIAYSHSLERLS